MRKIRETIRSQTFTKVLSFLLRKSYFDVCEVSEIVLTEW